MSIKRWIQLAQIAAASGMLASMAFAEAVKPNAPVKPGEGAKGGTAAKPSEAPKQEASMPVTVQNGSTVSIDYKLTVDGKEVDASKEGRPLSYVQGKSQIIPGLEKELAGLKVGDAKNVTVRPEEGYGQIDPKAFIEVPKEQLGPNVSSPQPGMMLRGMTKDGHPFQARIDKVADKTVTLDLNHPLAGKTLNFAIKVVDIQPAVVAAH